MTEAQLQSFRKALVQLKRELAKKGPSKVEPNRTSEAKVGGDEDEQPLNEMMQSIASARNKNLSGVLGKVEKALRKLDEEPDDFGICEDCNEDIILGRLKAMPYVEFCVNCQSKRDAPRSGPTRKKLTDFQ